MIGLYLGCLFVGFLIGVSLGVVYKESEIKAEIKLRKQYEETVKLYIAICSGEKPKPKPGSL
jgi:hypothetical protein